MGQTNGKHCIIYHARLQCDMCWATNYSALKEGKRQNSWDKLKCAMAQSDRKLGTTNWLSCQFLVRGVGERGEMMKLLK